MISERTVELNVTTELINFAWTVTGRVHFALAPSQRQEQLLGYDTQVLANGVGVFIQFKRAYVQGTQWTWHLNRTTLQDQHARLQALETAGNWVYYALPFFHLPTEVEQFRRRLLLRTFWFTPNQINPAGGPTGHHDVHFDSQSNRWWVTSDEVAELPSPQNVDVVFQALDRNENNLKKMLTDFNRIVLDGAKYATDTSRRVEDLVVSNYSLVRF